MENNQLDIGSLIATLGSNPALLSTLSGILNGASTESRREPPPIQQPEPSSSSIDPRLISALSGLLNSAPPKQQPTSHTDTFTHTEDKCHSDTGNVTDTIRKMLGGKAECENRIRLLNALRPYLSEERRGKLDMLLKLLKIAELGQLSGILSSF